MYIKGSFGLVMICLLLGCGILKKDKGSTETTTTTPVVADTSLVIGNEIPIDSTVTVENDTVIPPRQPLEYMTIEEKAMIDEINLLRADPVTYIQHVDAYIQDVMSDDTWEYHNKQAEWNAAEELIRELRNMPPLSLLKHNEALYNVAKAHGEDMKKNGFVSHRGSDDSLPDDRIRDSTTLIGNENIASGGRSVRESLIMLLVDANDRASRGHRRTILNPSWEFAACYYAGTINEIPKTWVQLFGFQDPDDIPVDPPIRSLPAVERQDSSEMENAEDPNPELAAGDFSFMSDKEKAMIDEINLMRSDPKNYIPFVEAYAKEMKKLMIGGDPDFDIAVGELKNQLMNMSPLSILKPHQKLYEVAKAHGLDNKNQHQLEHKGSDGRQSFDRVKDAGLKNSINNQGVYAPNENLVGGEETVRNSVIALLIDSGIATRGHRKALIEPTWEYVACYHIGTINDLKDLQGMGLENDDMANCWVQFFALGNENSTPTTSPPESSTSGNGETVSKPTITKPKPEKPKKEIPATKSNEESKTASGDFSFMTILEKSMIDEINLMRSDPKGYIKYVDRYAKEMKEVMIGEDPDFDIATNELKDQLRTMPRLSTLIPHQKLYEVAKAHGLDNKSNNRLEHEGSDKRSSFRRVKEAGLNNSINNQGVYAPNENLVGGETTVRNAVIALLIDAGISTRGHRKALIEPTWKYVACYHIGTIEDMIDLQGMGLENDDMNNCWIQFFAID